MHVRPAESPAGFRHWLGGNAWRIVLLFGGVLLPLGVFARLAGEVHELEDFFFDAPLLLRLQAWHGPWLDGFFVLVSRLGYQWGLIPADTLVVLALLALRRWREATFCLLAFVGSALLNIGAKHYFGRARPAYWLSLAPETSYSFPSGHAMASMTLAMVLALLAWRTRWRWPVACLAFAFALLVGASRVYLGVHFPSDILAGWTAAVAWTFGAYAVVFRGTLRPWRH